MWRSAVASALLVFLDACIRRERYRQNRDKLDSVVNVFDALGLGVFTVSGVQMAIDQYGMGNPFLLVLMGMTTGRRRRHAARRAYRRDAQGAA